MSEDAAEALLEEAKENKRHKTEPTAEGSGPSISLPEAVRDAHEAIANDELHENLTIRDENLAAFVAGLEETETLEDIGDAAADELGADVDDTGARATVLKLLVRVALDEVAPEEWDEAKEGRREYLASQADEF